MPIKTIPNKIKATVRSFLSNIYTKEGIIANSRVANWDDVRPERAVKEQKQISISVE